MELSPFKRRPSQKPESEPEPDSQGEAGTDQAEEGTGSLAQSPEGLRDSALLAQWYISHRLEEELNRARRYHRPLSVLVAQPVLLPGEQVTAAVLTAGAVAAQETARSTDLIGWLDGGRCLIIMPETAQSDADAAVFRWRNQMWLRSRHVGAQRWRIAAIEDPARYETAQQLIEAASEQLERGLAA